MIVGGNMKIYKGIIKKVPSEFHFEQYKQGNLDIANLQLLDTVIEKESENGTFQMLPIRLSYVELDRNGNEKYTFNPELDKYEKTYNSTPILYATGKEMRIIIEYGEYCPVKVVVQENTDEEKVFYKIVCVQNQHYGLEC